MNALRSERLVAEPIAIGHITELCRMHRDETVMATLGGLRSEDETAQFLASSIAHWRTHGFGLWVWRDPANGAFVGRAGIRRITLGEKPEIELAYALMADYWGRGLATEIGRTLLDRARGMGLSDVVAFTLTTNLASQRVMQKLGMRYEREISHFELPHALYRTAG
jgi:[ribosomal protein S5]-alanine N-acetyltransferase